MKRNKQTQAPIKEVNLLEPQDYIIDVVVKTDGKRDAMHGFYNGKKMLQWAEKDAIVSAIDWAKRNGRDLKKSDFILRYALVDGYVVKDYQTTL